MKRLLSVILLCALVGACSAATVSVGNIAGLNPSGTQTTSVYVDTLPTGLSGYNITLTVGDSAIADIYSITEPSWGSIHITGSTPAASAFIQVADLSDAIDAGDSHVKLCDVTVRGIAAGSTTISITVNQMDDDDGDAVSPSVSNGLIAVGSLYSVYEGIHIIAATSVTGNSLTLNGYVDDTTADPSGWFVVGSEPDQFAWTTSTKSVSDAGNISVDVAGAPLVAGETLYVRAACANGYSDVLTILLPGVSAVEVPTYSVYFERLADSDLSIWSGVEAWSGPFTDTFGGGETGLAILVGLLFGGYFVLMVLRQEDVAIPTILGLIFGGLILTGTYFGPIPPEFVQIGYALMLVSVAGIGYSIFRRD